MECVILLHGLARSSKSFIKMQKSLEKNGYRVLNIDYPSRRFSIAELAIFLKKQIEQMHLKEFAKVHFVTHSMGGILVRSFFHSHSISNLGRVVMLGPPNKGSEVVDYLKHWRLFKWLNGPAGQELGTGKDSVPNNLGPVNFELGVIAGFLSINWINSLMIPGPDDGKVSVESTKVVGMKEHLVLKTTHPMMMKNKRVIREVLCFLKCGNFIRSDEK